MFKHYKKIVFILILCLITLLILYVLNIEVEEQYIQIINEYDDILNKTSNKLFNLNFEYVLKSDLCTKNELFTIIIVTSYFGNVEARSAMRRAFSNRDLANMNIARVFLLGIGINDRYTKQNAIVNEAQRFGDILQGNFFEAYRNLTYKHLMGLKWASEECFATKYVIKMDDDIIVNMYKLVNFLNENKLPKNNLLAGYVLKGMIPIREKANKWFVTNEEYSKNDYPTFLSGWLYITNPTTSKKLVYLANKQKYFWIDDTFVTGILAELLHIKHVNLSSHFTLHPEFLRCCIHDLQQHNYECDFLIGPNGGDNNLFYEFNEIMKMCGDGTRKCIKRNTSIDNTCVSERKINIGRGESNIESIRL